MEPVQQVKAQPNPAHLPLDAPCIHFIVDHAYKGNKASGLSPLPSQLVENLHSKNDGALSMMFMAIATLGMPEQWNRTRITPVHMKGSREDAANYHPVSVMGPLAKLFAACLNGALEREAQSKGWRVPTQAGF